MTQPTVRLSLPSKGRLEVDALDFLAETGLRVFKPNPRQYEAQVPSLPELGIIFQRPGDIVVSVRQGSIDLGIAGIDLIEEKRGDNGDVLILHDKLGFGSCALTLAVPEAWNDVPPEIIVVHRRKIVVDQRIRVHHLHCRRDVKNAFPV